MGKSLLDRAKEVMSGAGVFTSLAIVPLAMSTQVIADSIKFDAPLGSVTPVSGGFGHARNSTLPGLVGVKLTGDTDVTDLNPNSPGYLTAREAALTVGKVNFDWGSQFDPDPYYVGSLSGDIHQGDKLNIMKNFSFQVNAADSHETTVPGLTWTMHVNILTTNPLADISYVASGNGQSGTVSGLDTLTFAADATAITWNISLEFDWALDVGRTGDTQGLVLNANENDRLQVNILSSESLENSMYISIDSAAAPLPSTAWMGGSLFGLVGLVRFRKSVFARYSH